MADGPYRTGRRALLEAAVRAVSAKGLCGLTYRAVASEAGSTHGLVRYHFGDWATLVPEASLDSAERSLTASHLESGVAGWDDFASRLASYVAIRTLLRAYPGSGVETA